MKLVHTLTLALGLIALSACGSKPVKKSNTDSLKTKLSNWERECTQERKGISCSKFAYHSKKKNPRSALYYYQKGCKLGDKDACYNIKGIQNKSIEYNMSVIEKEQENIFSCYVNYTSDRAKKKSMLDFSYNKEHKKIKIIAQITKKGKLGSISIGGEKLNMKGRRCMKKIFVSKPFLPSKHGQRLSLSLLVPKHYTRKKAGTLEKAVDGLKTLN
ncbi:MAG: hypothetical protein HN509_02450 [Halobacteriovoraceae bacterium]|jgi:hypothetical protein|nr:hypothetical protein [Halobacteriovoraceae bacterium]MBT5093058.1 hypothetical protein [Halobacteriovoraceae bacterium]